MAQFSAMITIVVILTFGISGYFEGLSAATVTQVSSQTILNLIRADGPLIFDPTVLKEATERRTISCFFVFDKDATADLNYDLGLATAYATQLALFASRYTAMINTVIINAGTEIWGEGDRISFNGKSVSEVMVNGLTNFQAYLNATQKARFGKDYAVGVLISLKDLVQGGYSQGPPCTTSGASLIYYKQSPYRIGGLLAHELAHTLSAIHPWEIPYLCDSQSTTLDICATPNSVPASCYCNDTRLYPPEQCLMTFQFGAAPTKAPKYTICDIKIMNYFSSNIACLLK